MADGNKHTCLSAFLWHCLYAQLFIYAHTRLGASLYAYLIHMPMPIPIPMPIHTSIHTSIHMSIQMSIHMSMHISIRMSIHTSIRTSIHISIHMVCSHVYSQAYALIRRHSDVWIAFQVVRTCDMRIDMWIDLCICM